MTFWKGHVSAPRFSVIDKWPYGNAWPPKPGYGKLTPNSCASQNPSHRASCRIVSDESDLACIDRHFKKMQIIEAGITYLQLLSRLDEAMVEN
jgi:hypothetical protein